VSDRSSRTALLAVALALLSLSVLASIGVAHAQVGATSESSETTTIAISSIPPSTGCTLPGYQAPASLLTTLDTKSTSTPLTLKDAPKSVMISLSLFLVGSLATGILILAGLVIVVVWAVSGRRQKQEPGQPPIRRSHRRRNVFLAVFLVVIIITAANFVVIFPYLNINKTTTQENGVVQNIVAPVKPFNIDPISIKYYFVPAYVNGQTTVLEGNYTVTSGSVQVLVIPGPQLNQLGDEVRNGTLAGASDCNLPGFTVYYNSGLGTSGSFAVQLPIVTNQTTYDVAFVNPSFVNGTTAAANVYWGY
jgi:hypothetical protein